MVEASYADEPVATGPFPCNCGNPDMGGYRHEPRGCYADALVAEANTYETPLHDDEPAEPAEPADDLYLALHGARERLCVAQLHAMPDECSRIEAVVRRIDAIGSTLPQWSESDRTHIPNVVPPAEPAPRRMAANRHFTAEKPDGTGHHKDHAWSPECDTHPACVPVAEPASRRMATNSRWAGVGPHGVEHDEDDECRFNPVCAPVEPDGWVQP